MKMVLHSLFYKYHFLALLQKSKQQNVHKVKMHSSKRREGVKRYKMLVIR